MQRTSGSLRGLLQVPSDEPLFGPEFPALLERLALLARQRFTGLLQAEHRSRALGAGLEFADHRRYVPGDDLRRIDWNIAARTDRVMIRRFEEEEDLYVYVVVDVSGSMSCGSRARRRRRALRLAAALSYVALVRLDRVSLALIDDGLSSRLPPGRGVARIHKMLRFLESAPIGGETDLEAGLREVLHQAPRKGLVVLLTDGYDERGLLRGIRRLIHAGYDASIVRVVDPDEGDFAREIGDVRFVDAETGRTIDLTLTATAARQVADAHKALSDRLRAGAVSLGVRYQERPVSEPFGEAVLRTLTTPEGVAPSWR